MKEVFSLSKEEESEKGKEIRQREQVAPRTRRKLPHLGVAPWQRQEKRDSGIGSFGEGGGKKKVDEVISPPHLPGFSSGFLFFL